MRIRLYMDIEVFWNYFCVSFREKDTGILHFFKISPLEEINQLYELCRYYESINHNQIEMVTFNGIHYDCPILNYIFLNEVHLSTFNSTDQCRLIKQMSNVVIEGEIWWKDENLKPYKYNQRWIDLDYFLYWSKMLRKVKKISLKSLGIQLGYPVVQELPIHFDALVTLEDIPKLEHYNQVHDITLLEYLDTKTYRIYGQKTNFQSRIDLRTDAIKNRGLPTSCYSWDDVKFGTEILLSTYAKVHGYRSTKDLPKSQYRPGTKIHIGDLISDAVVFSTSDFQKRYEELQNLTVTDTRSISMEWYQGLQIYDFGSGGLHNRVINGKIQAPKGYRYLDWDVASEYPSLCAVLNVSPPNLPGFGKVVLDLKDHRIYLKSIGQGKSQEANTIKLALNGGMGKFNEEHCTYFHPPSFLRITLNGQLYLLMLCEMLVAEGCIIDMANTDGVSFFAPNSLDLKPIWDEWEKITGLILEEEVLDTVWRTGINEYLCLFENGYLKQKGSAFIEDADLGNSCDNLIVPKAVNAYLVDRKPLKETILDINNHIFDYCAAPKVARKYTMFYGTDALHQRLNRFFVSNTGKVLTKYETKHMALPGYKATPVVLLNEFDQRYPTVGYYPVNYQWYINQAQKIIDLCESTSQMSLF